MRDKNQSFIQFETNIERFCQRSFAKNGHQFLTTAVAIDPTFLEGFDVRYPRKYKETFGLIVYHYYLPETLRWRVFLDLEEQSFSHFTDKQKTIIRILLSGKENMLKYLYRTETISSNELFGIVGTSIQLFVKFIPRSTLIVQPKRKRGYDDKGSRRPDERWLPSHDWTFDKVQNEIDFNTQKRKQILDRILSYLEN